ncbi:MAG TPA: hypothetical protein VK833_03360 [Gillisia sp.]|nr:hypothetical protein [Gillisia sp.]
MVYKPWLLVLNVLALHAKKGTFVLMNLFTSISLTFLFLLQGFGLSVDLCCELPKISNLLEHYEEHNEAFGDSFMEFLEEDYFSFNDSQKHHDNSDHEDLPFQGNHHCCSHTLVYYTLNTDYVITPELVELNPEYSFFNSEFFSEYLDSPFQPPQG